MSKKDTIIKNFLLSLFLLIMISLDYLLVYCWISGAESADEPMLLGTIITLMVSWSTLPIWGLIDGMID